MSLKAKHAELLQLKRKEKELRAVFEKELSELQRSISDVKAAIGVLNAGLDENRIRIAETVLNVRGNFSKAGESRGFVIDSAIQQFAEGGLEDPNKGLLRRYLGTKDYAHWHGQYVNPEYGYGPKHGTVIFRVELDLSVRKRDPFEVTDAEADAAIYYLSNLSKIQTARAEGIAA